MTVVLANPAHIENIPGRKTDVKDCQWLTHLLRHGLVRTSFISPRPIRELRDLTRLRRQLLSAATSERNRVQKVLEDANIKLASVLSDLFGVSVQEMLEALLAGNPDPERIASFARCLGHNQKRKLLLQTSLCTPCSPQRPQTRSHSHCPHPSHNRLSCSFQPGSVSWSWIQLSR
jgi:transposase